MGRREGLAVLDTDADDDPDAVREPGGGGVGDVVTLAVVVGVTANTV